MIAAQPPKPYWLDRHDVDFVFREYDSFRVAFNAEDKLVEKKYYENGSEVSMYKSRPPPHIVERHKFKKLGEGKNVKVFFDLKPGSQGFAEILHYEGGRFHYVEIHLPSDHIVMQLL
ncbi:hypothetical protein GOV09_04675 [Candidatus Woesearchaeota archaeon]|nr:hypothetical protein [Candidatus Woesearchaeota archaeon]